MKAVTRQTWSYAVLLVVLFAIASIAVANTIEYLAEHIPPAEFKLVAIVMWSLTLGFMLIAGSFALWTIQFSASSEMRKRVGRLVDAMDYIPDALLAIDRRARVRGANPALKALSVSEGSEGEALTDVFPVLTTKDVDMLLDQGLPHEVECDTLRDGVPRTLRFRSQPAEGLTLVLVSDVTAMKTQRMYSRQVARLQLIGELARGVAHDFNTLLCAIATHASLLRRHGLDAPDAETSVGAIAHAADRGITLAGQLLDLSHPHVLPASSNSVAAEPLAAAAERIRDSLPETWRVATACRTGSEHVPLSAIQVEQLVVNLALLCADAAREPSTLHIVAAPAGAPPLFDVGPGHGVVIAISTLTPDRLDNATVDGGPNRDDEAGVILSVLRSLVNESGGRLDVMSTPEDAPVYRVAFPRTTRTAQEPAATTLPSEITSYIARWTVLVAVPPARRPPLERSLSAFGAQIISVADITEALAKLESTEHLDALVIDTALLRDFANGLLRAVIKLRPSVAIVVLSPDALADAKWMEQQVVTLPSASAGDRVVLGIIEARAQAVRRLHDSRPV